MVSYRCCHLITKVFDEIENILENLSTLPNHYIQLQQYTVKNGEKFPDILQTFMKIQCMLADICHSQKYPLFLKTI